MDSCKKLWTCIYYGGWNNVFGSDARSGASLCKKSESLRDDMVDFGVPLFANIHLCGSVLTEVFFVMTVSKILYGIFRRLG
mgnify:CR=1 FL=1